MQQILSDIDRDEVLRYLGYKGSEISVELNNTIDRCITDVLNIAECKYIFKCFDINKKAQVINIASTEVDLKGNAIRKLLCDCDKIYVMCVTIGLKIEKLIRQKMLYAPDEAVIIDSCGSVAAESLAEFTQSLIAKECNDKGLFLTRRFSPGYADLPIDTQHDLITLMDSYKKIGLTLTDSMMMTPCKSVTAIIGVSKTKQDTTLNKCKTCENRHNCDFKRGE